MIVTLRVLRHLQRWRTLRHMNAAQMPDLPSSARVRASRTVGGRMEAREQRRTRATRAWVCSFGALALGACEEPCGPVGKTWCEGSIAMRCGAVGGHTTIHVRDHKIEERDCAAEGLSCEDTGTSAACVEASLRCRTDADAPTLQCFDDHLGRCDGGHEHPSAVQRCHPQVTSGTCVETADGGACTLLNEPCPPTPTPRCIEGRLAMCEQDVWRASTDWRPCFGVCEQPGATACFDSGVGICAVEATLWVLDTPCPHGCVCEPTADEQACRCADED